MGTTGHGDYYYADGFGAWHMYVKERQGGEIVAARSILRDALEERGHVTGASAYVRKVVKRHERQDRPGFVHFWESGND